MYTHMEWLTLEDVLPDVIDVHGVIVHAEMHICVLINSQLTFFIPLIIKIQFSHLILLLFQNLLRPRNILSVFLDWDLTIVYH